MRLGEQLLADGALNADDLERALSLQTERGGPLGRLLTHLGFTSPMAVQRALAAQAGETFLLLDEMNVEAEFIKEDALAQYLELMLLPLSREGRIIHLAAIAESPEQELWFARRYPHHYPIWHRTTERDLLAAYGRHFGPELALQAAERVWRMNAAHSARQVLLPDQSRAMALSLIVLLAAATAAGATLGWTLWWLLYGLLGATVLFKAWLMARGWRFPLKLTQLPGWDDAPWKRLTARELPIYTILVPLHREAAVVPTLIERLRALDYPPEKLDIKLIAEADDLATLVALKAAEPPAYMHIIAVPPSQPRTKPKACNYALPFAEGEFVTIYDAEDAPSPQQLRMAAWSFGQLPPNVACLQARLGYYNYRENWLTYCFALEYGLWFEGLLPGLERGGYPIPLGGTSNHLRREALERMGGWDAFNVTEDADLGLRLSRFGLETRLLPSYTMEEAACRLPVWLRQRTRWIKGYMQTWCVHMRLPFGQWRRLGLKHAVGFQLFIGGPCLLYLLSPMLWGVIACNYLGVLQFPPNAVRAAWFLTLATLMLHAVSGLMYGPKNRPANFAMALTFPAYWALHSLASLRALWQLFVRPHYWDKSPHGLTRLPWRAPAHTRWLTGARHPLISPHPHKECIQESAP